MLLTPLQQVVFAFWGFSGKPPLISTKKLKSKDPLPNSSQGSSFEAKVALEGRIMVCPSYLLQWQLEAYTGVLKGYRVEDMAVRFHIDWANTPPISP